MGFVWIVLKIVEYLWCIVMPVCGSLHLISSKYKEENKSKHDLLKHWCIYWMAFAVLHFACGFLIFLPCVIKAILKLVILSALACPSLHLTLWLFDFLQSRSDILISLKNNIGGYILGTKEKTE